MDKIKQIKERILSVLPANSFYINEFLKFTEICFDNKKTKSAAVTCSNHPMLYLNEDFINKFCKKDEHLFMLIMHEMYHIILGHTSLFSTHSEIDNIAFDAVINAMLCRMFAEEEYISFFKILNSETNFPGCILRPIGENTPVRFLPILNNLYNSNSGTYFEVYEAIKKEIKSVNLESQNEFILLGNHDQNVTIENSSLIKEIVEKLVQKWPTYKLNIGRSIENELRNLNIKMGNPKEKTLQKFKKILKLSGVTSKDYNNYKTDYYIDKYETFTPVINIKDRTILTKMKFYNPLLYKNSNTTNVLNKNIKSLVYVDVSGSVIQDLSDIFPLLIKPLKNNECSLFCFSNKVTEVNYKTLKEGKVGTTNGTDINCIFNHYFKLSKNKRSKKILILTDGVVGELKTKFIKKIKEEKVQIYVGLFGKIEKKYLENISKYMEVIN